MSNFVLVCNQTTAPTTATCEGVTSWVDFSEINPVNQLDVSAFGLINGALLLSFLAGHFGGRLVKWLGKK